MRQHALILLITIVTATQLSAQSKKTPLPKSLDKKVMSWRKTFQNVDNGEYYRRAISAVVRLNSNGWTVGIRYETKHNTSSSKLFQLTISEIRHEKETKIDGNSSLPATLRNPRPFIYGKINSLYQLDASMGQKLVLLPAVLEGTTSIFLKYSYGMTIGIEKPYYLVFLNTKPVDQSLYLTSEKYNSSNPDRFLNRDSVIAPEKWSKGLKDLNLVPGLIGDVCVSIQPQAKTSIFQNIELGLNGAVYTNSLAIMANSERSIYFIKLYLGLEFGKRFGYQAKKLSITN